MFKIEYFAIYSPTDYFVLAIFDHIGENNQTYSKATSTTNDHKIKVNSGLEFTRLIHLK